MVMSKDTTVLNVKIDKTLKQQAQAVASDLGLPMSTLVAASLREIVANRSITISDELRLKPEVEKELLQMSKDAKKGVGLSPVFSNAEDALAWLHSEDDLENA